MTQQTDTAAEPPAVRARLESGELETPQPGDGVFGGHATHLIATPQQSLEAAAAAARAAGIEAHILSDEMEGESRDRLDLLCSARLGPVRWPACPGEYGRTISKCAHCRSTATAGSCRRGRGHLSRRDLCHS